MGDALIERTIVVALDVATEHGLQLARIERFQGIELDRPLTVSAFKTHTPPLRLFDRRPRQAIVLDLVEGEHHRKDAHVHLQAERAHKVLDLARHGHRHRLTSRVKVRDIQDTSRQIGLL